MAPTHPHLLAIAVTAARSGAKLAADRYGVPDGGTEGDPVAALTDALNQIDEPVLPHWLYGEKKRDEGHDISWGPPTPLGAGDAAERNPGFNSGLGIRYGGV